MEGAWCRRRDWPPASAKEVRNECRCHGRAEGLRDGGVHPAGCTHASDRQRRHLAGSVRDSFVHALPRTFRRRIGGSGAATRLRRRGRAFHMRPAAASSTRGPAMNLALWLTEDERQALRLGSVALREVGAALTRSGARAKAAVSYQSAAALDSLVQRALEEATRGHWRSEAQLEAEP